MLRFCFSTTSLHLLKVGGGGVGVGWGGLGVSYNQIWHFLSGGGAGAKQGGVKKKSLQ